MTQFKCNTVVIAEPKTRAEYNTLRGWDLPTNENGDDAGYLVEFPKLASNVEGYDGYIQWLPEQHFALLYTPTDLLKEVVITVTDNGLGQVGHEVEVTGLNSAELLYAVGIVQHSIFSTVTQGESK